MLKARFKKIFKNDIVQNVLMLFSGSTLAQVIPFLIYPVLSRLYTPDAFGTLGLFSNMVMIFSVFATGKYELAIMLPSRNVNAINITGFCLMLIAAFWFITMLITIFFGKSISYTLGDPNLYPWIYLLPFSIAFFSVFHVMTSILNRHKIYRSMAVSKIVQSLSSSGVKLGGGFFQVGGGGLIAGTLFGQMMSAIFLFARFQLNNKKWLRLLSISRIKEMLIKYIFFPKFTMFHILCNSISAGLPIFAFSRYFSTHQAGLYSLGYSMVFIPLSLFSVSVEQVLYQNISVKVNSNQKIMPLLKDTIKTIVLLVIIPFIVVFVFAPTIFGFLFGPEWYESGVLVQIILPWLLIAFLASPLSFLPNIFGKQKKAMFIEIISFVLKLAALSIGVYYSSLKTGLVLFSAASFLIAGYCLIWYFRLAYIHDNKLKSS